MSFMARVSSCFSVQSMFILVTINKKGQTVAETGIGNGGPVENKYRNMSNMRQGHQ